MAGPSELRQHAAQCLEHAQAIKDPKARNAWLETALGWLKLAGTKERHFTGQQQQQIQPEDSSNGGPR